MNTSTINQQTINYLKSLKGKQAELFLKQQENNKDFHLTLAKAIQKKIIRARTNIFDFIELVGREETTQKRVNVVPHQRLGIQFILDHQKSVAMWPISHGKTWSVALIILYLLGQNASLRVGIYSATKSQAMKIFRPVQQYIEYSPDLKRIFPHLQKSGRESWSEDKGLCIIRPYGIKDPSVSAYGLGGGINGARLDLIIVDDALNRENTATRRQREKTIDLFRTTVKSRMEPSSSKIIILNAPWHKHDLVHACEDMGFASLRMSVDGTIRVKDDDTKMYYGAEPWDDDDLIPFSDDPYEDRLVLKSLVEQGHKNILMPARFPPTYIETLKREETKQDVARFHMCKVFDDESSFCNEKWFKIARNNAFKQGYTSFRDFPVYKDSPTFTGVDLAIKKGEEYDLTCFFTFEILPNQQRLILDIESGQFSGPEILQKIYQKHAQFNSIIRVENNAAQDFIRQFLTEQHRDIPIQGHTTGTNKAHPHHGVQAMFIEISNGLWLIPSNDKNKAPQEAEDWIDECLDYSPSNHTGDRLMASWFAKEQARKQGYKTDKEMAKEFNALSTLIRNKIS